MKHTNLTDSAEFPIKYYTIINGKLMGIGLISYITGLILHISPFCPKRVNVW